MPDSQAELIAIADRASEVSAQFASAGIALTAVEKAALNVAQSWSRSWIGFQSHVYYQGFRVPPPGAHFSSEWGFQQMGWIDGATTGEWEEFTKQAVIGRIEQLSDNPDLSGAREHAHRAAEAFEDDKATFVSIITTELGISSDAYLRSLLKDIEKLNVNSKSQFIAAMRPTQYWSRDTLAMSQGATTPPHLDTLAEVYSLRHPRVCCQELEKAARKAVAHILRKTAMPPVLIPPGEKVFIGHGRSQIWKDLKEFVQDRLKLRWEEFNRVSSAGIPTSQRLAEMMESARFAFLVLTAEDERKDGALQARMNVI